MIALRNMLFVALALAWAPITWHCNLEVLPALDFLACCTDEGPGPRQASDCEDDGCAVVESGDYKTQEQQVFVVPPLVVAWLAAPFAPAERSDAISERISATVPPEELHTWQFVLRTALPVRAPSIVS